MNRTKLQAQLDFLQEHHFPEWLATRRAVEDELSLAQPLRCICGGLATGLHESVCRKFQKKVTEWTVRRLIHLLPIEP